MEVLMAAKYTFINQDTCIACGACEAAAPNIYDLNDEGFAFVKLDNNQGTCKVPEEWWDEMDDALEECPTDSVRVSDQPFKS